ncbi:alpha/beta hydrolase [Virgibacillus indicus]|uniref:Alpha/beta hydrolase n=1 Tax=Virgibacillus indicus TaxID=2024554 RepID=A0A265NCC2_9BACI|nr:alpha/beta hydrolase [Virgibacillus indicus]OZU88916.1 alpha/beta hydrolase [Virgibacillus indicus]
MKKGLVWIFIVLILLIGCKDNNEEFSKGESEDMETVDGSWSGAIEIPNQPLNITVEFEKDDQLTGTISIPVQGVQNYPLSNIKVEENKLSFTMEIQNQFIMFDGTIDEGIIAGTFTQNGQTFPFELTRGEVKPIAEEDGDFLEVETKSGTLYGELKTPDSDGTFPIMIIIPGSGPTDRDGNSPGVQNDSLKLLAEGLEEHGIASLRYDKRGAGRNQGAVILEEEMDFDQFVDDAISWIQFLEKEKDYSTIGIIGHSQGSLVGMLAAQETNVEAFVSLAGAGSPIDEVLADQLSEQLSDELLKESEEILQQLKQGNTADNVSQELQSVFRPSVQPFLSSWMHYSPTEEIKKLEIPALIVNGKNDLQVPVSEAEKLHEAKGDSELVVIEKMNHVLKAAPEDRGGNLQTYGNPDLPLAKGLIKEITGFLAESDFINR